MSYLGRSSKLVRKAQDKVSFLATAGQTVKTGLSYTPTSVEVYVNGILLTDVTDYTASNGNSVTFLVALSLNDEVTLLSHKTFSVADHYTKTEDDALLAAKATIANFTSTGIDDNATSTAITINSSKQVGIGTDNMQMFNVGGGGSTLVVTAESSSTNVLANTGSNITIANGDGTADNTSALHFAREDTDGDPNYVGASVVAQFKETQVTGQYPKADLAFLTSTSANSAPSEKMRIDASGNVGIGTSSPDTPLDVTKAGGGNFVAKFQNTTAATPYGVSIKDAASGANGYPLLQVTNSSGSTAHLKVMSGTGDVIFGSIVTKPLQPAFRAYNNTGSHPVAGSNTKIPITTVTLNAGNHYNASTSTFTAPVTGNYYLNWYSIYNGAVSNEWALFVFSAGSNQGTKVHFSKNNANWDNVRLSGVYPMTAGSTVYVANGGNTVTYHGGVWSGFSGYLIG